MSSTKDAHPGMIVVQVMYKSRTPTHDRAAHRTRGAAKNTHFRHRKKGAILTYRSTIKYASGAYFACSLQLFPALAKYLYVNIAILGRHHHRRDDLVRRADHAALVGARVLHDFLCLKS